MNIKKNEIKIEWGEMKGRTKRGERRESKNNKKKNKMLINIPPDVICIILDFAMLNVQYKGDDRSWLSIDFFQLREVSKQFRNLIDYNAETFKRRMNIHLWHTRRNKCLKCFRRFYPYIQYLRCFIGSSHNKCCMDELATMHAMGTVMQRVSVENVQSINRLPALLYHSKVIPALMWHDEYNEVISDFQMHGRKDITKNVHIINRLHARQLTLVNLGKIPDGTVITFKIGEDASIENLDLCITQSSGISIQIHFHEEYTGQTYIRIHDHIHFKSNPSRLTGYDKNTYSVKGKEKITLRIPSHSRLLAHVDGGAKIERHMVGC